MQRAQLWQEIADRLCGYDNLVFTVSKRAVRDRYAVITSKYRKKIRSEERASGIGPEQSKLDALIEERLNEKILQKRSRNTVKRKVE